MAKEHTEFWLALLEFGGTEEEGRQLWNLYCCLQYDHIIARFLDAEQVRKLKSRLGVADHLRNPHHPLHGRLKKFSGDKGRHPPKSTEPAGDIRAFMDFSGIRFPIGMSFAGRLMIGADFHESRFSRQADFDGTEFLGPANFNHVKFHTDQVSMAETPQSKVSFSGATFHNDALFRETRFPYNTDFGTAVFRQDAEFFRATFPSRFVRHDRNYAATSFKLSQFSGRADFRKAVFGSDTVFDNAKMKETANFTGAFFGGTVRFHNCRFWSTTSFRDSTFQMTPEFFEAELHEDVDFSGIDWTVTEKSYHPSIPRDELVNDVSMHANHAMRAWERLELIMSRREKSADRHDFFRLKMRAQRWRDGSCLLSFLNWLFEQSSDYGWGVGRALCCWVGQLLAMGVILVGFAVICCPDEEPGWSRIPDLLMHGLLLSFANSHSFLGLGSGDGWLSGSRDAIVSSCAEAGVFGPIGLVQAVLGPVLLFLVLLTVRNRFRLG